MFRVVIPARFASTRLPGKPLLRVGDRPLLQWVHEVALRSGASEVIVATDDPRIEAAAREFGARVVSTSPAHASGTDRIAEVARHAGWGRHDIVVNLQGDEPLMPAVLLRQVAQLLDAHPAAAIATLATPLHEVEQLLDPNVVKVVTDGAGRALYFSRAAIPWDRDHAPAGIGSQRSAAGARRHIGLYAYRVSALAALTHLPQGALEQLEKLEQLRALENGLEIRVADAMTTPGPDVNTPEDLARVAPLLMAAVEKS